MNGATYKTCIDASKLLICVHKVSTCLLGTVFSTFASYFSQAVNESQTHLDHLENYKEILQTTRKVKKAVQ